MVIFANDRIEPGDPIRSRYLWVRLDRAPSVLFGPPTNSVEGVSRLLSSSDLKWMEGRTPKGAFKIRIKKQSTPSDCHPAKRASLWVHFLNSGR
ncbi:MAG: hypothetical protein CMM00_01815 [Rhodopirellula sp.]|nr:hypothetical protein [Rhodopirellula sp.]